MLNHKICLKSTQDKRNCEIIGLLLRDDDAVGLIIEKSKNNFNLNLFFPILSSPEENTIVKMGLVYANNINIINM